MRVRSSTTRNGKWSQMFANSNVYYYAIGVWGSINQRTVNGKYSFSASVSRNAQQISYFKRGVTLEMTQEEFYGFCAANSDLIQSIYDSGEKPSTDRIDDSIGYRVDNLQIISQRDNLHKRSQSCKAIKSCDPLARKIQNRFAYISAQIKGSFAPLNIDFLADAGIPATQIAAAVSLGLIQEPFERQDESKYPVEWLASWRAQQEAKKQSKLEAAFVSKAKRDARRVKRVADENRKEIKNHPFYKDVTKMIRLRKASKNPSLHPTKYDSIIFDKTLKNREKAIKIINHLEEN